MVKQVIVVRRDLKIKKGKLAVQIAHASLGAYRMSSEKIKKKWEDSGEKKVVLKVDSESELLEIYKKVKKVRIPHFLVRNAGLTQLKPGTITALGIGPDDDEKIDKVTGKLKLL